MVEPRFKELDNFFRVTFYSDSSGQISSKVWHERIFDFLKTQKEISAKEAQELWGVTSRTTNSRLKQMCQEGYLVEISTGPYDPKKTFRLT